MIKYLLLISLSALIASSCSSTSSPVTITNYTTDRSDFKIGNMIWGEWDMTLEPDSQTVAIQPLRQSSAHFNVTNFLIPPYCSDCMKILITGWNPPAQIADISLTLKNPSALTGYDVKAILSNYDLKEFLVPDAWCDFLTAGLTRNPYYIFAENKTQHAFAPDETHSRIFQVHVPSGATANAKLSVEASLPSPQNEPWRIDNVDFTNESIPDDGTMSTNLSCRIHDLQGDVEQVVADLSPLGGEPEVAFTEGTEGFWTLNNIRCKPPVASGIKTIWIKAGSISGHVYQTATISVIPTGSSGTIDIRLPSDDACGVGGTLAVRIIAPQPVATHFPDGAPIYVFVAGGTSGFGVLQQVDPQLSGFIAISFAAPGQGIPPNTSDGVFDFRGENTIAGLRDVIRFAMGELNDNNGNSIHSLVLPTVLTNNLGLLMSSNGGPLGIITLSLHGEYLDGVKYLVGMENPTNSQVIMSDAGPGQNWIGPPQGRPRFVNPEYHAWGPQVLDIDYSAIAYDAVIKVVYLERGGLQRFDLIPTGTGAMTSDLNRDSVIGDGEDWGFGYWVTDKDTDDEKHYYSMQVLEAVYDNDVFAPGTEPDWLPGIAEAQAFWSVRDLTSHFTTLASKSPNIKLMILSSELDHVQTTLDYAHIHQEFHGFKNNGLWVKLNPMPETMIAVDQSLAGEILPDYEPNQEPSDWTNPDFALNEDFDTGQILSIAGLWEMAELVRSGN